MMSSQFSEIRVYGQTTFFSYCAVSGYTSYVVNNPTTVIKSHKYLLKTTFQAYRKEF